MKLGLFGASFKHSGFAVGRESREMVGFFVGSDLMDNLLALAQKLYQLCVDGVDLVAELG